MNCSKLDFAVKYGPFFTEGKAKIFIFITSEYEPQIVNNSSANINAFASKEITILP